MKNFLLFGLVFLAGFSLFGQLSPFANHSPKSGEEARFVRYAIPDRAEYHALPDPGLLAKTLRQAPVRDEYANGAELLLTLPAPDGTEATFRVLRYQMITDELQAAFPDFVTATGWDVNDPARQLSLSWTDLGFQAVVSGGEEGRWLLSPLYQGKQGYYQSYFASDFPRGAEVDKCDYVPDEKLLAEAKFFGSGKLVGDCTLREYRLALACTGEYYAAVGGAQNLVVAEMINAIANVNAVLIRDLAIQLRIINLPDDDGNVQLVFSNPVNDPYTNNDGRTMLGENQTTCNNIIGAANYDIGHVFSTGGGGIASLESPCSSLKAQGVTGLANPTGDPFYIDFVAHEIGHQFGARHTFNSTEENCAERSAGNAYEPGSGTTIMAYAGICGPTANVQQNSDPYYHAASIIEIANYMELGGGNNCASIVETGNTDPVPEAGPSYTIPANVPFVLTASATDAEGDPLTYCWEQFDLGAVVAGPPTGTETEAPLFRSFSPTTSPTRFFPNLSDLVAGNPTPWEVLPQVPRDLTFAVTVRDFNAAGNYGCATIDYTQLTVVDTPGADYAVLTPNGGEVWQAGSQQTVNWRVGGTDVLPISCSEVDIVLSSDGGTTFDQVLATAPNTGTATVPAGTTTISNARLMIRCSDNVFFDVSDADFSIEQTDYAFLPGTTAGTACDGATTVTGYSFTLESLQGYTGTVDYTAVNLPNGATVSFSPNSTTLAAGGSQTVTFSLSGLGSVAAGTYVFQIRTDDGVSVKTEDFSLSVKSSLETPTLILPVDNGSQDIMSAAFTWTAVTNATQYRINFYEDAARTQFIGGTTPIQNSINFGDFFDTNYDDGDILYWEVEARDTDCAPTATALSPLFRFTFGDPVVSGNSLSSPNSPVGICEGNTTDETLTVEFLDADLTGPATLSLFSVPSGLTAMIAPTTISDGGSSEVSLDGEENLTPGTYVITVRATDGASNTEDIDLRLVVGQGQIAFFAPVDGAVQAPEPDGSAMVGFQFEAIPDATGYVLDIDGYQDTPLGPGFGGNAFTLTLPNVPLDVPVAYFVTAQPGGETSCVQTITFSIALPVSWKKFTARTVGKTARLEWSVLQDVQHAGFTVERTTEAAQGWASVAYVARSGADGVAEYAYTDVGVQAGETYLYRLRQEDVDGTIDYSVIRSVTFAGAEGVEIFPNPVTDVCRISLNGVDAHNLRYELFSALGATVATGELPDASTELDLGELPPAVYQLLVTNGTGYREVIRIVRR